MAFIEIKHWRNDSLYVVDVTTKGVKELLENIVEQSFNDDTKNIAMDLPSTPSEKEFKKILKKADKAYEDDIEFEPIFVGSNIDDGIYLLGRLPDYYDSSYIKVGDYVWYDNDDDENAKYGYGKPVKVLWAGDSHDGVFLVVDSNGHNHMADYREKWYRVGTAKFVQESYDLYDKYFNKGNWNKAIDEIIRLKRKCGELVDGVVNEKDTI